MKPLQSVAMGLVIIVLVARWGGYDALPDPVGWLLALLGVRALPESLAARRTVLTLGGIAMTVSVITWFPGAVTTLEETDASLLWAVNLPQLGFTALLCHSLAAAATEAGDRRPAAWLRTGYLLTIVVGMLPVLVFGAGFAGLEVPAYVAAGVTLLLVVWLLFSYAGRPWARDRFADSPAKPAPPP